MSLSMCLTCLLGVDAWPDGISEVLKLSRKNVMLHIPWISELLE